MSTLRPHAYASDQPDIWNISEFDRHHKCQGDGMDSQQPGWCSWQYKSFLLGNVLEDSPRRGFLSSTSKPSYWDTRIILNKQHQKIVHSSFTIERLRETEWEDEVHLLLPHTPYLPGHFRPHLDCLDVAVHRNETMREKLKVLGWEGGNFLFPPERGVASAHPFWNLHLTSGDSIYPEKTRF